jgi:hypothetical protein
MHCVARGQLLLLLLLLQRCAVRLTWCRHARCPPGQCCCGAPGQHSCMHAALCDDSPGKACVLASLCVHSLCRPGVACTASCWTLLFSALAPAAAAARLGQAAKDTCLCILYGGLCAVDLMVFKVDWWRDTLSPAGWPNCEAAQRRGICCALIVLVQHLNPAAQVMACAWASLCRYLRRL